MTPVLEAEGLCAGYSGTSVVRDLHVCVEAGEVVAILGPNGAGKTTTLLTLAGQLSPISGEVRMFGRPERSSLQSRARRGLALVADDRSIFFGLTARENLRLGRGTIDDALAHFPELADHLDKPAGLLSGGQQQMLAVGRALAARPALLLVDELSLGLAPMLVRRLLEAVRAAADAGAAVLLVEQYARLVLDIADGALLLSGGRIRNSGTAHELREELGKLERGYLGSDSSNHTVGSIKPVTGETHV